MKNLLNKKISILAVIMIIAGAGIYFLAAAADHLDAPGVKNSGDTKADITDLYAFAGQDTSNLVFVCNIQGFAPQGTSGTFDPNILLQFKIDNNGDNVEDLVIQCTYESNTLTVRGPAAPNQTGTASTLISNAPTTTVAISSGSSVNVGTNSNGTKIYAGPREDPFFFDLSAFTKVVKGDTCCFRDPGVDVFANTNILSTVVEVPKSLLPGGINNVLSVWTTTSR